jgi:hypothetical protein
MTVTLANPIRNAKVAAATALMNGGRLKLRTAGNAVVADMAIPSPAFSVPGGGQANLATPLVDPFTGAGTVTQFTIEDFSGTLLLLGTVTEIGGGGDIEVPDADFSVGDRAEINSLTYLQPANGA